MLLSIVIPSIPSRIDKFFLPLYSKIEEQAAGYDVEILAFFDNKKRSIGFKRDGLVKLAKGDYIVMVDDDDDVSSKFVPEIITAITENPNIDLITFNMKASINGGNWFVVRYDLSFENEEARQENGKWVDIKRKPFHNMVWKSSIAKSEEFPDASYGEDYHWAKRLHPKVQSSYNINRVLSYYRFNDSVTEAEHVFPEDQ